MLLYTKQDLDFIQKNLDNNKLRFSLREFKCYFGKHDKYLIQHIDNFALGLAYDTETKTFIYNYPHLPNLRAE